MTRPPPRPLTNADVFALDGAAVARVLADPRVIAAGAEELKRYLAAKPPPDWKG